MGMDRLTLLDVAKASDPDGTPATIAEVLNQANPILQDAPTIASNAQMGNRVTLRAGLPGGLSWTKINQGYSRGKAVTQQRVDTIGLLSGRSEVDARMMKILGASAFEAHRGQQDRAFLEAMAQEVAGTLFYGDEDTAESEFTGLAPRLTTLSTSISGSQVHDFGDAGGDLSSIYCVDWHPDYVALIHPKDGTAAGLDGRNLGEQPVNDADSLPMQAFVMIYDWMIGLTVKDPRRIARLANIDVSDALAATTTELANSLTKMLNNMPPKNAANRVLYCTRDILTAFELQLLSKSNIQFSWMEYLGEKTLHFKGIPIRYCDQISQTETELT